MPEKAVIGIDIGGTNIKAGFVHRDGVVSRPISRPTCAGDGRDALLRTLAELISAMRFEAEQTDLSLCGIGVGTAGFVTQAGMIASATSNLPGWQGMPLKAWLESVSGLPASVMNDVHAMALGESWIGDGAAGGSFVCIALGTGIGGAVIDNGRLYSGRDGYAGGFGHFVISRGGLPCNCGRRGCWEQYGSVSALRRLIMEAYPEFREAVPSPQWLFDEAREGAPKAAEIVREYASWVGEGIVNLLYLFNPPAVRIGGAITAQGEELFSPVRKYVAEHAMSNYLDPPVSIMPITGGDEAALAGAAKAIWDANQKGERW